jgi:hypothetical protein
MKYWMIGCMIAGLVAFRHPVQHTAEAGCNTGAYADQLARSHSFRIAQQTLPADAAEPCDPSGVAFEYLSSSYLSGTNTVVLGANGRLTGLDGYQAFRPLLDYRQEPGQDDRIWLKNSQGQWEKWGLQMSEGRKTLDLISLEPSAPQRRYHLQRRAPFTDR